MRCTKLVLLLVERLYLWRTSSFIRLKKLSHGNPFDHIHGCRSWLKSMICRCTSGLLSVWQAHIATRLINKVVLKLKLTFHETLQQLNQLYGLRELGHHWFKTLNHHYRKKLGIDVLRSNPALYDCRTDEKMNGLSGTYIDGILGLGTKNVCEISKKTYWQFEMADEELLTCTLTGLYSNEKTVELSSCIKTTTKRMWHCYQRTQALAMLPLWEWGYPGSLMVALIFSTKTRICLNAQKNWSKKNAVRSYKESTRYLFIQRKTKYLFVLCK